MILWRILGSISLSSKRIEGIDDQERVRIIINSNLNFTQRFRGVTSDDFKSEEDRPFLWSLYTTLRTMLTKHDSDLVSQTEYSRYSKIRHFSHPYKGTD